MIRKVKCCVCDNEFVYLIRSLPSCSICGNSDNFSRVYDANILTSEVKITQTTQDLIKDLKEDLEQNKKSMKTLSEDL